MNKKPVTLNDWALKPMPVERALLQLDGTISAEHYPQLIQGYKPQQAADKWFIYFNEGWLHFHRAQTGSCIFSLQLDANDDHYTASTLLVNRHPQQYRSVSDTYDVQLLSYLIDRYLLGRSVSFPAPPKMSQKSIEQHQQHVIGESAETSTPLIDLNSLLDGLN